MFRSPITKEGNLRVLEIIKYASILSLVFGLYAAFTSSVVVTVLIASAKLSSIFVIVLLSYVSAIAYIEIKTVLDTAIIPIITYIQSRFVIDIRQIIDFYNTNEYKPTNATFKELNVFLC